MSENIYEAFNRSLREAAVKKGEAKDALLKKNPKQSKTIQVPYLIKFGDKCDYFK